MIKFTIPPQHNKTKIHLRSVMPEGMTKVTEKSKNVIISELSEVFLTNFDSFLSQNNGKLKKKDLKRFLNETFPGLNIKVKKLWFLPTEEAGVQKSGDAIQFSFRSFKNPDSQQFRNTADHETIHMLQGCIFGFPVEKFEKELFKMQREKHGGFFKSFIPILKSSSKHHSIYNKTVYCKENQFKGQIFDSEVFRNELNDALKQKNITDIKERFINLQAFYRRLSGEKEAYNIAEYNTNPNPLKALMKSDELNKTYEFDAKIRVLKEEIKGCITSMREL